MNLTPEQEGQIRLLSDGELYQRARNFVTECQGNFVEGKQQMGILEFSRTWKEINAFIQHQKGRDWETISKKKAHYKWFYAELQKALQKLHDLVTEQKFITGEVPTGKKERQEYNANIDQVAGLLAHEFIQHVVSEMRWQEAMKVKPTQQEEENHDA